MGVKGYKAFNKGMTCRGKQYAENTIFEEDAAALCKKGIHFVGAETPLEVLEYYPLCKWIPVCVKTEQVDGERIKEDTFYKLVNGKFTEV